ncbi:MAG: glutamine synthetase III [Candidatus Cloacimonadota bacterium]|nr:glutamine synthetase III [Candidatus Cloacimonadota bacterium]
MQITKYFGELTFNKKVMREKLNKSVYEKMIATIESGAALDQKIAADVAHAMKEWSIQMGATHFTHWFQPLRGGTAEKHDAFICYDEDQQLIERFSAKQLIQSEPDASSFPSGGIRSTFEARGYTAWDPTSPAFLMESGKTRTLVIPSVYLSWTGYVLDMKTPLLRSQIALSKAVLRLQKLLKNRFAKRLKVFLGLEQEYFLISKKHYNQRVDLQNCGRTLFGAAPEKGQINSEHYFGEIKDEIMKFMIELDYELYRRGIPAKTRHNEVAPNQFEIAPLYEEANLAIDHNLQVMQMILSVAKRNGMVALLHEKPFYRLNGSGKHLNWSMQDATGTNYLEPSKSPLKNINFLVTIAAVLWGVQNYGELLRASVADAGNDQRLGKHEAPPAIMSVYLGEYLDNIFDYIEGIAKPTDKQIDNINLDIQRLPKIARDMADRNRTSPLAFTGNKFEFRAVGSHQNCSEAASSLNIIIAAGFDEICDRLVKLKGNVKSNVYVVLKKIISETKGIRYEGNSNSEQWLQEAIRRKLPLSQNTPQSLYSYQKHTRLFQKYNILSQEEIESKIKIKLETYYNLKKIEYKTAVTMVETRYLPAILSYLAKLVSFNNEFHKSGRNLPELDKKIDKLQESYKKNYQLNSKLNQQIQKVLPEVPAVTTKQIVNKADKIMEELRKQIDNVEQRIEYSFWPLPGYREILFDI